MAWALRRDAPRVTTVEGAKADSDGLSRHIVGGPLCKSMSKPHPSPWPGRPYAAWRCLRCLPPVPLTGNHESDQAIIQHVVHVHPRMRQHYQYEAIGRLSAGEISFANPDDEENVLNNFVPSLPAVLIICPSPPGWNFR